MTALTARQEWGKYWTLPIAAALGYATSVIHIYGLGPFVVPISEDFGWSRSTVTFGITIATLISAVFAVPLGMLVDRVGPRPIGIVGVALLTGAFALIGFATTQEEWTWYLLWAVLAFATVPVQATVWTAAVASRFEASRGLAFAITLCGASVAQALFPWLGTELIAAYGWQTAMIMQAAIWAALALPVIILFFRGARDIKARPNAGEEVAAAASPGHAEGFTFVEGLKSSIYLRLLLASVLFTFVALALVVNFIPILTDSGMEQTQAGALAFWIGIFAIVGRLATGFLLDRLRGNLVGAAIFCFPILACLSFLYLGTDAAFLSAALIGLTVGAEVDVIVYLATRYFGLKAFGALYGGLLVSLSIGTAAGPLAASAFYDTDGNYVTFFWLAIGCMVASVAALASLPDPAFGDRKEEVFE